MSRHRMARWRRLVPPMAGESPEARAMFVTYLTQEHDPFEGRCIIKLAEDTSADLGRLDEWASAYEWDRRARDADERANEERIATTYEARHKIAAAREEAAAKAAWRIVGSIDKLIDRLLAVTERGGAMGQIMAIKHALALVGISPVKRSAIEITTDVAPRAMLSAVEVAARLSRLTDEQLALLQADDETP